jgi:hypothetical protein
MLAEDKQLPQIFVRSGGVEFTSWVFPSSSSSFPYLFLFLVPCSPYLAPFQEFTFWMKYFLSSRKQAQRQKPNIKQHKLYHRHGGINEYNHAHARINL